MYLHKNIFFAEQFERRLEQWKEDDQQFVSTEAEKHVMQKVLTQSSITLVGNSGTGKSFLSKHIALKMIEDGYTVIPCSKPEDIEKWFKHGRKTVFVFDDVCGRYTLNQQIYTEWKQRLDHTTSLLKDKCCKILSTCRLEVFKDEQFSNLSIFKMCSINLSSQELKLTDAEKIALAEMYFKESIDEVKELSDKYDFFPLLCSLYNKQKMKNVSIRSFFSNPFDVFQDQIVQMYEESEAGKMQYCSLVLCVMFNNTLTEENLSTKDKQIREVIEELLEECELNKGTSIKRLKKSLETLEGTYVVKEDSTYKIIHDKLFDFLAKYLGEKMLQVFIDHANTDFTAERFLCKITENMGTEIEFVIRIPDKYVNCYIDRLLKDWENGYVNNVCQNRNMNYTTFTEKMVTRLNQLDISKQTRLVCTQDIHNKDIALGGSCYVGSVDLVKWLISKNSDINYCDEDGSFPLLWASQEGHVNVVKELLQHSADVNQCVNNDESPLYIASENGHVDVVAILLQHSADVNQCTNDDESPLYIASQEGYVNVVIELLRHSADVNQCTNDDTSPLFIASQEGHVNVVKALIQHSAECSNDETSPLFIASQEGHVNVVKELIQHSAEVNKCRNNGVSPLFIASQEGHVNVVKELLQHSADVNHCDNDDESPLYIASGNGHVDVVTELLRHSADVNQCTNDNTSPLFMASQAGHVNVVKALIQHSAEVNKCRKNGVSPLFIASVKGHVDVVTELLQCSADVNQCDFKDRSPLSVALEQGHIEIQSLLKGKGANQH
ncbi:CDK inhibitor PHO81 [Mytilus galloprovincialis]|uniref:CDK inhibitor PHO81 n=1 Tax=Mytilus galloprovincialis TaxID=29158 RepID=A0A8B6ENL1_MYTGA|nr:CDK inhibitor PHO81 [Mytilus galloprovincialis]